MERRNKSGVLLDLIGWQSQLGALGQVWKEAMRSLDFPLAENQGSKGTISKKNRERVLSFHIFIIGFILIEF